MAEIEIFTDGGCWGNPGPGAWAYVIKTPAGLWEGSGVDRATTNNRMELQAVIEALTHLESSAYGNRPMALTTDSQYVKNGITTWIHTWVRNSWRTANKQAVKNQDLWMRLLELQTRCKPVWHWVKGHQGHVENERCDALVQEALRQAGY